MNGIRYYAHSHSQTLHACPPAALHYASRAGHSEVAAKLVIAGSAVQAGDAHGITAAHLAAERGFAGGAAQ